MKKDNKTILQFDLEGNFLKAWDGYTQADVAREVDVEPTNLCAALKGRVLTSANFQWRYKDGSRIQQRIGEVYQINGSKVEVKNAKYFNGKLIAIYDSIEEAAEKNNLDSKNIHRALYSDIKCGGFEFNIIK